MLPRILKQSDEPSRVAVVKGNDRRQNMLEALDLIIEDIKSGIGDGYGLPVAVQAVERPHRGDINYAVRNIVHQNVLSKGFDPLDISNSCHSDEIHALNVKPIR